MAPLSLYEQLELVNQTQRDDIVSTDTCCASEVVLINQVDFVINVGGHVFVEVVSRANINIFQQILVAVAVFQVLTFRLQVRHGWTQTEVELILRNHFEVLRFVSPAQVARTGRVVSLSILCSQVDVVRVVFQTTGIGLCAIAFTVVARSVLVSSTFRTGDCRTDSEAFAQIVGQRAAVAITVLTQRVTTVVGLAFAACAAVFTLVLQREVQTINQTEEVLVTVGREAVTTLLHEVVRTVGIAAEFRQNVVQEVTS